jgi:hypothetical protein
MTYPELLMRSDLATGLTSRAKRRFLRRLCASLNQRISKTQFETQYRLEETATRWLALQVELPEVIADRAMSILDEDLREVTARFISSYCTGRTP